MKKKRLGHLWLSVALVALLSGCGHNKNLEPVSEINFHGADPPSLNIGVNPPLSHQTYFVFTVKLTDNSLSLVPTDSWTLDNYHITYTLLNDPGHHLMALPADRTEKANTVVKPGPGVRFPVQIVTDTYLRDNASGFIGTSDTAMVKANVVFRTHRNKDGFVQDVQGRVIFTIGNF